MIWSKLQDPLALMLREAVGASFGSPLGQILARRGCASPTDCEARLLADSIAGQHRA